MAGVRTNVIPRYQVYVAGVRTNVIPRYQVYVAGVRTNVIPRYQVYVAGGVYCLYIYLTHDYGLQ